LLTTICLRTLIAEFAVALCGRSIRKWWGLASSNKGAPDNGSPTTPADLNKPFAAQQHSHAVSCTNRDAVLFSELLVSR